MSSAIHYSSQPVPVSLPRLRDVARRGHLHPLDLPYLLAVFIVCFHRPQALLENSRTVGANAVQILLGVAAIGSRPRPQKRLSINNSLIPVRTPAPDESAHNEGEMALSASYCNLGKLMPT